MRQAHNIRNCDEAKQYPILLVAIKMIFPNFFQIDFENIKVPFLLLIEVKLIRNLFGKCELESCSIKSRSEGFTAYIFHIVVEWEWSVVQSISFSHYIASLCPCQVTINSASTTTTI